MNGLNLQLDPEDIGLISRRPSAPAVASAEANPNV